MRKVFHSWEKVLYILLDLDPVYNDITSFRKYAQMFLT